MREQKRVSHNNSLEPYTPLSYSEKATTAEGAMRRFVPLLVIGCLAMLPGAASSEISVPGGLAHTTWNESPYWYCSPTPDGEGQMQIDGRVLRYDKMTYEIDNISDEAPGAYTLEVSTMTPKDDEPVEMTLRVVQTGDHLTVTAVHSNEKAKDYKLIKRHQVVLRKCLDRA
jgi:hypothetical protein